MPIHRRYARVWLAQSYILPFQGGSQVRVLYPIRRLLKRLYGTFPASSLVEICVIRLGDAQVPLLQLFLALDIASCPGNSFQAIFWNGLPAIDAFPICAIFDALKGAVHFSQ